MMKQVLFVMLFVISAHCFPQEAASENTSPDQVSDAEIDRAVDQVFDNAYKIMGRLEHAGAPKVSGSNHLSQMRDLSKQYAKHAVHSFSKITPEIKGDEHTENLKKIAQFSRDLFRETFDFVRKLSDPAVGLVQDIDTQ